MSYKIYKIITDADDGSDKFKIYIGSTTKTLNERLKKHKSNYKDYFNKKEYSKSYVTSFEIIKHNWFEISLIKDCGFITKKECLKIESDTIKSFSNDSNYIVVNKVIPDRTHKEYLIDYNIKNKDKIRTYLKNYALLNKEKLYNYHKTYMINYVNKIN